MIRIKLLSLLLLSFSPVYLTNFSYGSETVEANHSAESVSAPDQGVDTSLVVRNFQLELLKIAMSGASKFPLEPHIKNRSRAQEKVIDALIDLEQISLAQRYTEEVANWRRGLLYAKIALFYAEKKDSEKAVHYLESAKPFIEDAEDWRRDRIRRTISQTYKMLGDESSASSFSSGLEPSEARKLVKTDLMISSDRDFDEQFSQMSALIDTKNFDDMLGGLDGLRYLYSENCSSAERRKLIENKVEVAVENFPVFLRLEQWTELARIAKQQGQLEAARNLARKNLEIFEKYTWKPDDEIKWLGRISALYAEVENISEARELADRAMIFYSKNVSDIYDIFRADALIEVAEAYAETGDREESLEVYREALKQSVQNPNARPTTDDLVAICVSLSINNIEPDQEMLAEIKEIESSLSDPW